MADAWATSRRAGNAGTTCAGGAKDQRDVTECGADLSPRRGTAPSEILIEPQQPSPDTLWLQPAESPPDMLDVELRPDPGVAAKRQSPCAAFPEVIMIRKVPLQSADTVQDR